MTSSDVSSGPVGLVLPLLAIGALTATLGAQTLRMDQTRIRAAATSTVGGVPRTVQVDQMAPAGGLIWPDASQGFPAVVTIANPVPSSRAQVPPDVARQAFPDGGVVFALTAIAALDVSGPVPVPVRTTLDYHATLRVPAHSDCLVLSPVVTDPGRSPGGICSWSLKVDGVENGIRAASVAIVTTPRKFSLPPSSRPVDVELQVSLEVRSSLVLPFAISTFALNVAWDTDFTPPAVTVPLAFREIRPRGGAAPRVWDLGKAQRILGIVNHIFGQGTGIQFTLADYQQVIDPGLTWTDRLRVPLGATWFDMRRTASAGFAPYARSALIDPARSRFDSSKINIYLVRSMGADNSGLPVRGWTHRESRRFIAMSVLQSEDELAYVLAHELGHALGLGHNFDDRSGAFARCQDCAAHQFDYVRDLSFGLNGKGEDLSLSRTRLETLDPTEPYSSLTIRDLLRNVMSYYSYFAVDVRGLRFTADQIECMHRSIPCHFGSAHRVSSVVAGSGSFPGPTRVTLLGSALPAGAEVRIGDQTAATSGSGARLDADFATAIPPGRHTLDLWIDGRMIDSIPAAVAVTPWCDWSFEPSGALQIRIATTSPGRPVVMAMGLPIDLGPIPGLRGMIGLDPTTVVPLTSDSRGQATIAVPDAVLPLQLLIGLQAVELAAGGAPILSNRDAISWR